MHKYLFLNEIIFLHQIYLSLKYRWSPMVSTYPQFILLKKPHFSLTNKIKKKNTDRNILLQSKTCIKSLKNIFSRLIISMSLIINLKSE